MCLICFTILAVSIIHFLLFESPLLCYVVQSWQHPLMASAYHFPLSFPASAARGGNTLLLIGDHCFGNCYPRFKWEGDNEWFGPHSLDNLSKWNERIHYSVQYVEPYALSYIKPHNAVLRSSIDRSICICLLRTEIILWCVRILCMSLRNGRVAWWSIFLCEYPVEWLRLIPGDTLQCVLIQFVQWKGMK